MDLFLLIGQSNMAGRGALTEDDRSADSDPNILMLDREGKWQKAREPIHYDKPDLVGVGPGLTFAKTLLQVLNPRPIGLIPCAVGGTKIERWISTGDLYQEAIARCRLAMNNGKLSGILWAQGESDSADLSDAEPYHDRLFSMIHDIRSDLDAQHVPFIASELGTFIEAAMYPFIGHINQALHEAQHHIESFGLVSSAGLQHLGDNLHYDAVSARELGKRMAATWLKFIDKE